MIKKIRAKGGEHNKMSGGQYEDCHVATLLVGDINGSGHKKVSGVCHNDCYA